MTDEYPILFIMAALINGKSFLKDLRPTNKESNRILEIKNILDQIDIRSKEKKMSLLFTAKGYLMRVEKVFVKNLGDHRICMSTFILALLTGVKTKIKNFETVFTSSPSFLKIMRVLGAKFEIQK